MNNKTILKKLLSIGLAVSAFPVFAQPTLRLIAKGGLVNSTAAASLTIANSAASGGFNAHIILPEGTSVAAVDKGTLLSAGQFILNYNANGRVLKVLVYSATDTFSNSGELLKLSLQVSPTATAGLKQLNFANINKDALINSKHALAGADGLFSVAHAAQNVPFLIYTTTSDFDSDGIPDYWEIENGLDPTVNDAGADSDGDGYTNLEEYTNGTNPHDNTNYPPCDGDKVVIQNHTYPSGVNNTCKALTSLSANTGVAVNSGAKVNYRAPIIVLKPDFKVLNGGYFSAKKDSAVANPTFDLIQNTESDIDSIIGFPMEMDVMENHE